MRHRAQSAGQIARLAPRRQFQISNRLGFAVVDDPQQCAILDGQHGRKRLDRRKPYLWFSLLAFAGG